MSETTTEVTIRVTGRRATIEDVQEALDVLRAEGIPDTFEVSVDQREGRTYAADVPFEDRPVEHSLVVSARRAAASAVTR